MQKITITNKDWSKPKNSAIVPISGGPIRKPKYPSVATPAIPIPGSTPLILLAQLNRIGTVLESPSPRQANPNIAPSILSEKIPINIPTAPNPQESLSMRADPQ